MVARASSFVPRKSRTNYSRNRDVRYIKTNSTCTQLEKKIAQIHDSRSGSNKHKTGSLFVRVCVCGGLFFFVSRLGIAKMRPRITLARLLYTIRNKKYRFNRTRSRILYKLRGDTHQNRHKSAKQPTAMDDDRKSRLE